MNFCLKRQPCFVCPVLLFLSPSFFFYLITFQIFFFCHLLHTNLRPNCGHGASVYSWFASMEQVRVGFNTEITAERKCLMYRARELPQLMFLRCCCLESVSSRYICILLHHIFQSSPGLEMLPLFGVLHVQLMFFIINASQNLQPAPDLHIKETH